MSTSRKRERRSAKGPRARVTIRSHADLRNAVGLHLVRDQEAPRQDSPALSELRSGPGGEEAPALGHVFVGIDWTCGACQTPNSRAAAFCVNCGHPQEGNADVALVID